jgi:hypothetical protein
VNAAGRVTVQQRALIAGRRVRPPVLAWMWLTVWVVMIVVMGFAAFRWDVSHPSVIRSLGHLAVFILITGIWYVPLVLVFGWSRWRARLRRRRRISAVDRADIAWRVGRIAEQAPGGRVALLGVTALPVPEGAPPLPEPGTYRFYWLRSGEPGPGALLLSADPVDESETGRSGAPEDAIVTTADREPWA